MVRSWIVSDGVAYIEFPMILLVYRTPDPNGKTAISLC